MKKFAALLLALVLALSLAACSTEVKESSSESTIGTSSISESTSESKSESESKAMKGDWNDVIKNYDYCYVGTTDSGANAILMNTDDQKYGAYVVINGDKVTSAVGKIAKFTTSESNTVATLTITDAASGKDLVLTMTADGTVTSENLGTVTFDVGKETQYDDAAKLLNDAAVDLTGAPTTADLAASSSGSAK